MSVDISKIKPGDKVTLVPLEVRRSNPLTISVSLPNGGGHAITSDQIAAHHPAPREFQVGDRVSVGGSRGTIEHVSRGKAWVVWDDAADGVWSTYSLTLVEAGQ